MAITMAQRTMPRGRPRKTRGYRNCKWIEKYCRIPEGKNVGKSVKLAPFMAEEVRAIYDNPAGTRRAIFCRARKNSKTTECAFLLLLHLCGPEAKPNSQLYSSAQSREQAGLLFALAAKIVRLSPELRAVVNVRDTAKQLVCQDLGTSYRALSAEASTAYGLSPALIIHDELGQCRGNRSELFEALETATAAQEKPLSVIISTQAPTDADLLSVLIDDALAGHDPRTIVRLHVAPPELDPFSEEAIRAANPAYDHFMNRAEVLAMCADAKRMPSRQAEYENLILNRRVEATAPFVSRSTWKLCGAPVKSIDDVPVYGGLDLAEVKDLTALVLIGKIEGIWQVHPTFWLPKDGLAEKSRTDRVPYDQWAKDGYLITLPGKSIDYEHIAEHLIEVFDQYQIEKLAFDRWNFRHLKPWLVNAGFSEDKIAKHFVEFGQGFQSMSPALRDLESEILNGRIAHGNHPVLTMCAGNAVVQSDPAGNRKLAKHKSAGRIDGMVALAMAMGVVANVPERKPEFQVMIM
jgi:phage terminase large subunit-like protein